MGLGVMGHMGNRAHGQWDTCAMDHICNGQQVQWGILVNTADRDDAPWGWGTWVMGHMGNWAHGHKILNTAGILTMFLQYIDMEIFYLNTHQFFNNGLILVHF